MPERKTLSEDLFYRGSSSNLPRLHTCKNKVPFWDFSQFAVTISSTFTGSMDFYDCLLPFVPIIHHSRQVFKASSCESWLVGQHCHINMQENITYESVLETVFFFLLCQNKTVSIFTDTPLDFMLKAVITGSLWAISGKNLYLIILLSLVQVKNL